MKAIARAKIKTDKRDSEVLAHLLRMNMVPEVYRRSTENGQAQRVLRQMSFYVSVMTALKNRVYAFLSQQREEVQEEAARKTNLFSDKGQKVLLGLDLAPGEKRLLEALLKIYRYLEMRIHELTELVEKLYEKSREAQRVRTIPGFGKFLSVLVDGGDRRSRQVRRCGPSSCLYGAYAALPLTSASSPTHLFSVLLGPGFLNSKSTFINK